MNNISHNSTGNHLLNVRNVRGQFEKLIPKGASEIFGFGFIFIGNCIFLLFDLKWYVSDFLFVALKLFGSY